MIDKQNQQIIDQIDDCGQRGASLVEYALLVALIAIIAIVAMQVLGNKISTQFSAVASQI